MSITNSHAVGIALSFGLFAWLCVSMRIYVRFIYQRVACGIDDILLFIALIFYTALCGLAMHLAILHWGSPTLDIPSDNIPEITELWWIAQISYDITTMFIRLSIGVFLLRFLISRTHRLVVTWTVGIMCVFSIFYAFFTIFQCWPVAFFWTRWRGLSWKRGELPPGNSTTSATQVSKGYCFPYSYVPYASVAHSVVSGVSDVRFFSLLYEPDFMMCADVNCSGSSPVFPSLRLGISNRRLESNIRLLPYYPWASSLQS